MAPRVALALGAGGARGYAHIGVIQVLEERGYDIVAVAGTSMGALVGGLYAAGRLPEYTEWVRGLTPYDVWRLIDMNLGGGGGAIRLERIFGRVSEILDGARIEDCRIPYTAVATDLNNRREVWFQQGLIATAVRASVGMPSIITPIVVDGRLLVDGGLMNPVPIEPTTAVLSDLTIAVSLQSGHRYGMPVEAQRPPGALTGSMRSLSNRVSALIGSATPERDVTAPDLAQAATEAAPDAPSIDEPTATGTVPDYLPAPKDLASSEIFNRSFDTMAALITRYRMASNPPDVLVAVPSDACKTMEFHRAKEMISLGRELAERALDDAGLGRPTPESPAGST